MSLTSASLTAKFSICGFAFISTFYTLAHFTFFISNPNYNEPKYRVKDDLLSVTQSLIVNMSLLSLFILQHTLMAHPTFKNILLSYNVDSLQRSVYVICTTLVLQAVMSFWRVIPSIALWKFQINDGPAWWAYVSTHSLSWILIYVGSIFMDIPELLGYKQVLYSIKNLPDPLSLKSLQLQKLYKHMRHPGFLSFIVLFWFIPVMSLDRLLLAIITSAYMYIAWQTDANDYEYQVVQYNRKYRTLNVH